MVGIWYLICLFDHIYATTNKYVLYFYTLCLQNDSVKQMFI